MNSINETYVLWLSHFKEQVKNPLVKNLVEELINTLPHLKTIDNLIDYLKECQTGLNKIRFSRIEFYVLNRQLQNWIEHLEGINKEAQEVISKLEHFQSHNYLPKVRPLIKLLINLILEPSTLINVRILSLLKVINSPECLAILHYISQLKPAPLSYFRHNRGTFQALTPTSSDEQICISLLNSLASTIQVDGNNKFWNLSNTLLQTTLLIYQDEFTEVELNEKKIQEENNLSKRDTCKMF
ncbi:MAG TPA: hypothetical protein PK657_06785 [Legionella sp.]|nr:hypothetical protein [Legionella sp.]